MTARTTASAGVPHELSTQLLQACNEYAWRPHTKHSREVLLSSLYQHVRNAESTGMIPKLDTNEHWDIECSLLDNVARIRVQRVAHIDITIQA